MSRVIKVDTNSVIVDNDASTAGEHFIKLMLALLMAQDVSYEYAPDSRLYDIAYNAETGVLTWEDRNDPGTKSVAIQNPSLVGMLRESFGKAAQDFPTISDIRTVVQEEIANGVPTASDVATAVSQVLPGANDITTIVSEHVPTAEDVATTVASQVPTLDQITEAVASSTREVAKVTDVRDIGRRLIEHNNNVTRHFQEVRHESV